LHALRDEVETALRSCKGFPASVQIDGKLNHLDSGLSHQNYWFRVKTDGPQQQADDTPHVLRKLRTRPIGETRAEALARLEREAMVLQALASQVFDFSVPRFVCFVHGAQGSVTGLIETALLGVSFAHLKKQRSKRRLVIETIARVASAIHRTPLDSLNFLPRHQDSGAHVLARLGAFDSEFIANDPEGAAVADWVRDHVPENRPAVLLHGDLLPQNVLWDWETDGVGVVDWEFAGIGDAAHDLAIVTRGHAKLFGEADGLRWLIEAYRRAGGVAIEAADVVNHELLLVLRWLAESVWAERELRREGHPPAYWRNQIRAILRRAGSS
jgi:aminoglycoside phosphotransferase (APT) family kinase protein